MNSLLLNPMGCVVDSFLNRQNFIDSCSQAFDVTCDYRQKDGTHYLSIVCPGISKEDIYLDYDGSVLSISIENKTTNDDTQFISLFGSKFEKRFRLPQLDFKKAKAEYQSGVLYLTLPDKKKDKQVLTVQ